MNPRSLALLAAVLASSTASGANLPPLSIVAPPSNRTPGPPAFLPDRRAAAEAKRARRAARRLRNLPPP